MFPHAAPVADLAIWCQNGSILEPFTNMPNLSIKNVPDDVVERLRARARANHRSLQGELLELACRAAEGIEPGPRAVSHLRAPAGGEKTIEEIFAEHTSRRDKPLSDAPLAVDLIRQDRDGR
jgi:plasmid stability protein